MFINIIKILIEIEIKEVSIKWVLVDLSLNKINSYIIKLIVVDKIDNCVIEDKRGLIIGEFNREEIIKISDIVKL